MPEWRSGWTLFQAAHQYGAPEILARIKELGPRLAGKHRVGLSSYIHGEERAARASATNRLFDEDERLRKRLAWDLVRALQAGDLIAAGFGAPPDLDSDYEVIPARAWDHLKPNFNDSSAGSEGFRMVGIRVLHRDEVGAAGPAESPAESPTMAAERRCRQWIRERIPEGRPKSKEALMERALREIPRLSKASYLRAWKAEAPDSWKRPGARKLKG